MSHDHEHEHEHEHEHRHHHSHEESLGLSWADVKLEAHTHEQAATVSMDITPKPGCEVSLSELIDVMRGIARTAEAMGGIVGHIKAFGRQGDVFAHASVTAADLTPTCEGDRSFAFGPDAEIQLVAIVLLIEQAELLSVCKAALAS